MKDLIIVGAGGFGRELLQWVKDINAQTPTWNIKGFLDDNDKALDGFECDYNVIGSIKDWKPLDNEVFALAIGNPETKVRVVEIITSKGGNFVDVIHPTASISSFCKTGKGLVMYPNTRLSPNVVIGDYVTLLSGAGHNAEVGDYSTISSYCDITGGVKLGKKVFFGSHVTVVPERKIGDSVFAAAGSVIMTNIHAGNRVMGNPAKKYEL